LDALTGPTRSDVDRIIGVINRARSWQAANKALAGNGVRFTDDHPDLNRHGALGAADGTEVVLNASFFHRVGSEMLRTTIEHELTHREQMLRAAKTGADPKSVTSRKLASWLDKWGRVNLQRYLSDPLEMQALAYNAVRSAGDRGADVAGRLRSGTLAFDAPLTPRNRKRFGKYAYQIMGQHKPTKPRSD
jgi:hypothetical protein